MDSFFPGQRWVSNTESELGLGLVAEATARRVELSFPAAGERRVYAIDNAPLSRVEYQAGEEVSTEGGQPLVIVEVISANNCLIYGCVDHAGGKHVVPEQMLNSSVQFSKPQDRLFAGQIDRNNAFELRGETFRHLGLHNQSRVLGLLGPRVQFLPHQLYIAGKIANRYAPRVLLADEVGLGKTIEAGLILHQQLISGLVRRVLIVVPDSLLHQWLVEMLRRFNLLFTIVDVEDDEPDSNPFENSQLVLCTLSSLSKNPRRQAQAMAAGWDLLVVDEAHHLHWSEHLASPEYLCIEALGRQAPGLLLLTATPEQLGVESHFARLRLLDPDRYYDLQSFIDEELKHQPLNLLVQRLLAQDAREQLAQGDLPAQLAGYLDETAISLLLASIEEEDPAGFTTALEVVIRALLDRHGTGRVLFRNTRASVGGFPERKLTSYPLTAPDLYRVNLAGAAAGELLTPERLLGEPWLALDPRVQWLTDWLEQRRGEKVLIICAHAATAIALEEHLRVWAGVLSAVFHEGVTLVARDRAAAYFADEEKGAQVLVCSEIGSEGRNFQFARHLVLFDLPLNPDLLEQRIGRLDRIGQRNTVQIHVPFYERSAQSVLLRWYHEGLNAIEFTCPAGQALFEYFEQDLLRNLEQAGDLQALEQLLQQTRDKTAGVLTELQQGRDRLLELNSFNRQRADEIIAEMILDERRKELSDYMERVFDLFGVEQEHHSTNSLVIRPGAHMPVHSFPALPEEGITATYQRDLALLREDMHYLTWEHPLVSGAMDMVLSGEFGNTAFCTVKLPPLKPGTILLEVLYALSCIAPGDLQLNRFLPVTTLRLVIDNRNNDLTGILSSAHLSLLVQEAPLHNARELVRHTRPRITKMLEHAGKLADAQKSGILEAALASMRANQQVEWERLQALAALNPNIRAEELSHARGAAERLEPYLGGAQMRLDALRVTMVTE
jgi:ATP-dependent helicase HepA